MKTLLIPLAAFAVTVTGASAFNGDMLKRAGLNDDQISAFETAKELKEAGNKEAARDVLLAAGVDEDVIRQVREAMREHKSNIHSAIEDNDYDAFKTAVEGSAFADMIDSEEEFERLVEAYQLMKEGKKDQAKDIFDELGLTGHGLHKFKNNMKANMMSLLNAEQRSNLHEAIKDKDRERVREILAEVGMESGHEFKNHGDGHDDRGFGNLEDDYWQGSAQ